MYSNFVVLLLASAASVVADLGKSSLFPQGLHDPLSAMDNSYNPPNSFVYVTPPSLCVSHAQASGCNTATLQAISATYGDCSTPWTICRCDNANMNIYDILYRFGQIPVGVRSYVGSMLAVYASSCSAGSGGDFIVFNGDCPESVFVHESGHSLDQGTSSSSTWTNAVASSSCVPDPYADTSYAEDFAQNNVLYTYALHIGTIPADTTCLNPQLNVFSSTPRLATSQTTTTCFPDKRPFTLAKISAVVGAEVDAETPTKTPTYVPIKPTYFPKLTKAN